MTSTEPRWLELQVEAPAGLVQAISARLFAWGASGVQEDYRPGECPPPRQPWDSGPPAPQPKTRLLKAWFEEGTEGPVLAQLQQHFKLTGRWTRLESVDWEHQWKEHFQPIVVDEHLTIAPPWDPQPGALLIEPGTGFGTGQHPTTLGLLKLMRPLLPQVSHVLDIGCGSGILALAAAQAGCVARGIDVHQPSIVDAQKNAKLNGLNAEFSTTELAQLSQGAPLVLANLYAELLIPLCADLLRLTEDHLLLAGILASKEQGVRQHYEPSLSLIQRVQDGEWVCLHYRRAP